MRKLIILSCWTFITCVTAKAQRLITPEGAYMDTTLAISPGCGPPLPVYYYQIGAKYPASSQEVLKQVTVWMEGEKKTSHGDGYITYQFYVDCEGKLSRCKVLQTDIEYRPAQFDRDLVEHLYQFVKAMPDWPKHIEFPGFANLNYIAYVSFKIRKGRVAAVIP